MSQAAGAETRRLEGAPAHSPLRIELLERYQRDLPLTPQPYATMSAALGCSEQTVIATLEHMRQERVIARVGPVFRPNTIGASTLAAMAVPQESICSVAERLNERPEINHNYERDHRFNLWFVVTAPDRPAVLQVLSEVREETGIRVLDLPLRTEYHIDLGFSLRPDLSPCAPRSHSRVTQGAAPGLVELEADESRLVAAVQTGLPLVPRPFRGIAETVAMDEETVLATLRAWQDRGIVRRIGLIASHRELGYRANAMVVWDVPDHEVDAAGFRLGNRRCVNLCYRRPRAPGWPYNLFCMVHGNERGEVCTRIEELAEVTGLQHVRRELLFSVRRFKQTGARYRYSRHVEA